MSSITGRIVSLQFEGGLAAAVSRGHLVRGPHWRDPWAGRIADRTGGSRRPAIYPAQTPVQARVEVELVGTNGTGLPATLTGRLGNLSLAGMVPLRDGIHSVQVIQNSPLDPGITRYVGNATWTLAGAPLPAQVQLANTTLLEIFVVLGSPPAFFRNGIWVEALRFLVDLVGLSGISDQDQVLHEITDHCHKRHGLRYMSGGGHTTLGVNYQGGNFALATFLEGSPREVHCFDISAAVLVLAGAVGISVNWLKILSFGYINQTSLVGIGDCNSPFFTQKGTGPIVDPKAQNRSRFNIHAFCESPSTRMIFDACVGPHLGRDKRGLYLKNAADTMNFDGEGLPGVGDIHSFTLTDVG